MLLTPVLNARVSQAFGLNPEAYARFGLLGHNGIDYAVPQGTPVRAVAPGKIIEQGTDQEGYGLYVKLQHDWGESIYAHLSHVHSPLGGVFTYGQVLGLSGNTGNSTGPHLHFGIRVTPYFRQDGWMGYTDPAPYMVAERGSRIGLHLAGSQVADMMQQIERLAPATVLYLDPDAGMVRQIKKVSPHTIVVGRIYRPDSEVADRIRANPQDAGRWMDGLVRSHSAYGLCDYWQVANEVCQVDWVEYQRLCDTMMVWMDLSRRDYGCAIFGFSVGQPHMPEQDRMAFWRRAVPALEMAVLQDHVLLIHQYGAKDLWGPDADWYIHRFEHQVWPRLGFLDKERQNRRAPTLKGLKVIVGEYGIDGLILGEKAGYQRYTTPEGYAEMLKRISSYTGPRWPHILGYCVYTCGHADSEWASYDIWPEVVSRLPAGPTPPAQPSLRAALLRDASKAQVLRLNPKAALQKRMLTEGFVPTSPEFTTVHGTLTYTGQRAESLKTGAVRVYYVPTGQWDQIYYEEE